MGRIIVEILVIAVIAGVFWYCYFASKEKRVLKKLQYMIDQASAGSMERSEISEQKISALEDSLKRYLDDSMLSNAEKQKQKDMMQSLISDISHQTLTPISNIKIYGEILAEECKEQKGAIDTILEQTEKLEFLVESLVKLSRMENGIITVHPKKQELSALFQNLQQEYEAKAREKEITFQVEQTPLSATYDLKWTTEAIGNIIDNAMKYTMRGGQVTIQARQYSFFVRIDIKDNGIGIEKEEIPNIFTRFYRSFSVIDAPGVGVGLYLAREIIQEQKGYIKVESIKGEGSLFSVFLSA